MTLTTTEALNRVDDLALSDDMANMAYRILWSANDNGDAIVSVDLNDELDLIIVDESHDGRYVTVVTHSGEYVTSVVPGTVKG
ncbi:hypothetical protein BH762_gp013 [Gordonia phage OneUp]|uniref:Uncharacterized protein n=1 Tax=Gordonia phage OneUp TaxID=1838074 RepID=A0A160DF35_9CAUD|nr:hypothetical protein BH762_gp013 [Gordonia phage OneUp]ANA86505.1 hypothetical protein PBI_ONEUP_172 [Gordonia phage OneUp]